MKFFIDNIFLIAIVLVSGGALLWPSLTVRGKRGSPQDITMLINRGKTTILDVRDAKDYAEGHLPEAKNIPLAQLDQRLSELDKFKNRCLIVIGKSDARGSAAAAKLGKAGFGDVVNLEGGVAAWQKAGLPLAK
ncbi:rhodanese-like domain-containing protein [Duganella sp. FT135W]|uniref:Rhodanese-like domain-containing protein n=1 Tax=Duganella flavida TaxID=2692175 RepID=A0A6L8K6E4_9BURK|nr:rhodanese-like domain-containing protein [Duganella flavida]